jgi:hypothetical protein
MNRDSEAGRKIASMPTYMKWEIQKKGTKRGAGKSWFFLIPENFPNLIKTMQIKEVWRVQWDTHKKIPT